LTACYVDVQVRHPPLKQMILVFLYIFYIIITFKYIISYQFFLSVLGQRKGKMLHTSVNENFVLHAKSPPSELVNLFREASKHHQTQISKSQYYPLFISLAWKKVTDHKETGQMENTLEKRRVSAREANPLKPRGCHENA